MTVGLCFDWSRFGEGCKWMERGFGGLNGEKGL